MTAEVAGSVMAVLGLGESVVSEGLLGTMLQLVVMVREAFTVRVAFLVLVVIGIRRGGVSVVAVVSW